MKAGYKYEAKIIDSNDLLQAGRLRYKFFVEKKSWVRNNDKGLSVELDRYDSSAIHFGVFSNNELVGYMRAVLATSPCGMMIDHDFKECLSDDELKQIHRTNSLELSRRVVSPRLSTSESLEVVQYLFYEFYDFCKKNNIEHVYLVQELSTRKIIRKFYGLEFNSINKEIYQFPDGVMVNVDYATISGMESYATSNDMLSDYTAYLNRNLA